MEQITVVKVGGKIDGFIKAYLMEFSGSENE